jgi:D-galactose 1-dehydrogenase
MKKPIRIGVVGLGKIARAEHLPAIANNPDFELAFLVDRAVELDLGVPSHQSLFDALESDVEFDAIAICTSPQVRYELCELLFQKNCAVLLEKPAAASYALAKKIEQHARALDMCLFATWHSRFAPHVQEAKEWAARQEIVSGQITWRENVEKWHPGQDWIWREGGFGVFDPGMNALSLLTQIVPAPWSLGQAELKIPTNVQTPSCARFTLNHRSTEVRAHFEFHDRQDDDWTIRLVAENGGTLELFDGGAGLRIDGAPVAAESDYGEYEMIYKRFSKLISSHQVDCDLTPLRIIEEILTSADTRQTKPIKL